MARRTPLIMTGGLVLVLLAATAAPAVAAPFPWPVEQVAPNGAPSNLPGPSGGGVTGGTGGTGSAAAGSSQSATSQASPSPPPASKSDVPSGTAPYPLDFTMPTLGKSGCQVCHADPNLIRIKEGKYVSFYVPNGLIESSAHGPSTKNPNGTLCTGCHVDFASTSQHKDSNWQKTSKQACRSCHPTEDQDYSNGVHAIKNQPGKPDPKADQKPLCGDCHGGHEIQRLTNNPAGQAALHADGWQVCGRCHPNEWNSYADYYHGAAYRAGAPDAPACWDCHGAHKILPSSDRQSPTNAANLVTTCGKCHKGANEAFVSYTGLVHKRTEAMGENPVVSVVRQAQAGINAFFTTIADAVGSLFG